MPRTVDLKGTKELTELNIVTGKLPGHYIINKQARNPDVDSAEDIWCLGGDYPGFPSSAAEEIQILSDDANDTIAGTGARTVRIFYLNDDYEMFDANGDYLYVDVDLNGTTAVDSGVTGMRVWNMYAIDTGSSNTNAGTITVRWKTTTAVVFMTIEAYAQTFCGNFTVPAGYTAYLRGYGFYMEDTTSNDADIGFKFIEPDSNGTERLRRLTKITTDYAAEPSNVYGGLKFTEKTDIVPRCTYIKNVNGSISGFYDMLLVKNT